MLCDSEPLTRFFNPANVGDARTPSFTGRSASLQCGASLRISLHIDESQRIEEAKFRAAGCSAMVAAASLLTEQIQGKTTGEAASLACLEARDARGLNSRNSGLLRRLGNVAAGRSECIALACDALVSAIREFSDSARDEWQGDEALICTCFGVSETTIEREIKAGSLTAIAEVTKACNAGAGCRSCYPLIEDILDEVNGKW
jgi:NifU-like protein